MRQAAVFSTLALALLGFRPVEAPGQDYAPWIQSSTSRDNPLILEMISQGDLGTGLEIAAALGLREDVQIEEIILAVGESVDSRPTWERELIIRVLLASVFPSSIDGSELERRLRDNREGMDFLVSGLPYSSLSLKREVIRVLGFLHPPAYESALMVEGRRLADVLRQQRGQLNGEQAGVILAYLETVGRIDNPDFADIVLQILEASRHLEVAAAARSVSRSLLLDR
jgi:hypothetical protein